MRVLGTSCDYLCTALTDLLRIRGYSREKAGFTLDKLSCFYVSVNIRNMMCHVSGSNFI